MTITEFLSEPRSFHWFLVGSFAIVVIGWIIKEWLDDPTGFFICTFGWVAVFITLVIFALPAALVVSIVALVIFITLAGY